MINLLDTSGLICPMPVLKAKKALQSLKTGEILKVIATDKAALKDFPAFCEMAHYTLLEVKEDWDKLVFEIRK